VSARGVIGHLRDLRRLWYLASMDQSTDLFSQPADYYRRKAARARQVAEGVTTRAVKTRLLDLAVEYDRLADGADTATRPPDGFPGK
jgi:hypothetical protein